MITIEEIREKLLKAKNPLIFFDDDADGTCSFALIYKFLEKGHGVIVKSSPVVKADLYIPKIHEYDPDLVVVLDKPKIQDEFLEQISCDIIWIDHHEPQEIKHKHVYYYNPMIEDKTSCTSAICWDIVHEKDPDDIWIAFTGAIGDWYYDEAMKKTFLETYPGYINEKLATAPEILFTTKIGLLVKVIAFNLKGKLSDVKKSFRIITRIQNPDEILKGTTPAGKYIFDKYSKINSHYDTLLKKALAAKTEDRFLVSMAPQPQFSFSSELSNEVLFNFPDKIIIVGRINNGEAKCSIRTGLDIDLRPIMEVATSGIGYGGGHAQACGACIKEESFNDFLDKLKAGVEEVLK